MKLKLHFSTGPNEFAMFDYKVVIIVRFNLWHISAPMLKGKGHSKKALLRFTIGIKPTS